MSVEKVLAVPNYDRHFSATIYVIIKIVQPQYISLYRSEDNVNDGNIVR